MEGKVQIHSEKNVTVDDLLTEAKVVFKKVKSGMSFNDIETAHRQFCTSYPIVVRYMYETGTYFEKAFRQLLRGVASKPHQSEEEYLDSQSRYVVNLHRCSNPRVSSSELSKLRDDTMKLLKIEHETFKREASNAKELVEHKEQSMKDSRASILKSLTPSMPIRDLIVVESDPTVNTPGKPLQIPDTDLELPTSKFLDD